MRIVSAFFVLVSFDGHSIDPIDMCYRYAVCFSSSEKSFQMSSCLYTRVFVDFIDNEFHL